MTDECIWTIPSLKVLHDQRIDHLSEKIDLRFELNQLAVNKAEAKMDIRLDSFNEWRQQNKDERTMYATKQEVSSLSKLVYLGFGILLAVQFFLMYYKGN